MSDTHTRESPIEAAAGSAGSDLTDVFKLLTDETRLAILLVLWEAYEPFTDDNAVPFSEVLDRVGYDTPSNFSYHLDQLTGQFVRKTDDGYELRRTGRQLVQTIISGSGIEDAALEPTDIDQPCDFCDAPTELTYGNGYVYQVCTECPGYDDLGDQHPEGTIRGRTFDPAGLSGRTAEEVWAASKVAAEGRLLMQFEGVCPLCSGRVEKSMEICPDHDTRVGGTCGECGRNDPVFGSGTCTVCKRWSAGSKWPKSCAGSHPAVIAFMWNHGIDAGYDGNTNYDDLRRRADFFEQMDEEIHSVDPPRLRITVSLDGDRLDLLMDETMTIVDVTEDY